MKKLTFLNALFNYNKANEEIDNLVASNGVLIKKAAELEHQKSKVDRDLVYMTSEMKKFKSLSKTLNDQVEQLAKTIEDLSKTDIQPDININVTTSDKTSDVVTDTVKAENVQPKPQKHNKKK
jgi:predicted nuclease with TOPRIM domain